MTLASLAKAAARRVDRLVPASPGVTVLIFHRVGGGSDSAVDLPTSAFEAHLEHLVQHHRVLTLDHAVDALASGRDERGVVITFDDGTADFVDHALPLLQRFDVPATLYLATSFVESGTAFPWGAPPVSWSGLADAVSTGLVTVGSHTHAHRLMRGVSSEVATHEVRRSVDLIGERLGVAAQHFAYPKAVPGSRAAEQVVRTHFRSAALAGNGANRAGRVDLHRLRRVPVQRSDDAAMFAVQAAGGLRVEGAARALATRVRYRGSVT